MAESLVGKIVSNAGKQWNRNTVADGTWLNTNTVQKFNENDKTLAEAIENISAAMGQFTPEITPSAWPCESNKTIQTIEQNSDGSLNVTYQPIETSTTSNESLLSWYQQDAYDTVYAEYTKTDNDINHISGELSENLTIPAGIYDVKIEVLYEPTKSTVNNKLDIAISKSTSIDDALYQTFILFDDTLLEDDVQSQWITGIINLSESTTLKFLIKGESAQGRYKLNNIYINSIVGAKGDTGEQGPQGEQGETGASGYTPLMQINSETNYWEVSYDEGATYVSLGVSATGPQGEQGESGANGADGKTPLLQINATNAHWQYRYSESEEWTDVPNTPVASGTKGEDGEPGTDGISPTVSTEQIEGGNRVTFTYDNGTSTPATESIDVMSGVSGENGTSVIVKSIREFTDTVGTHTKGGTEITLEWNEGQTVKTSAFSAFNGEKGQDGSGASYTFDTSNTLSGDGSSTAPIGVNTSVIATQTWVGEQGYLTQTALNDYATKEYANDASANALNEAKTWVEGQNFTTSAGIEANKQYVITTNGWTSAQYISVVNTDNDTISGDGVTDPLSINNTYVTEWNKVAEKQNISDMSAYPTFDGMTESDYYCWSGTSGEGGQWSPISDKFYSKTEAARTFLQIDNVISGDHTGVSGTGSSFTYTYIPMDIVTSTPTVDDGILHIILDS